MAAELLPGCKSGQSGMSHFLRRALLLAVLTSGCGGPPQAPSLVLATTTSVANSGLLDKVVPAFERETGTRVQILPVGSGRALRMLELGQADVVISHAPRQEAAARAQHPDWTYRKVLYNDFLIAGPADDPAGAAGASDALDAMRRIAGSGASWVSRGDESGTHERETELWSAAGVSVGGDRLVISGQGMGGTLRVASEIDAYTLTDRGTFEQLAPRLALKALYEGDARLLNTYAVLTRGPDSAGRSFASWLAEGAGRDALERLLNSGEVRGFTLWPADSPGERPDALPRR